MEKLAAIIIVTYVRTENKTNSMLEGFADGRGMMRHGKLDAECSSLKL